MSGTAHLHSDSRCVFCADAPEVEFDYCHVCGRGGPLATEVKPMTGMRLVVRAAKGGPLSTDGPADVAAFTAGMKTDEGRAIAARLRAGS